MSAPFLVTGDLVVFPVTGFTDPVLTADVSVPISGTGTMTVNGMKVCVDGDESSVTVVCAYFTKAFPIPGSATLTIKSLDPAQKSQVATSKTKAAILATAEFIADLKPDAVLKAKITDASGVTTLDPTPSYPGKGRFQSQNTVAKTSK